MAGLKVAVLFCVFLIQKAASQGFQCQSDLYMSIDDLMRALNNGPYIPGLLEANQNSCGCQPVINQCSCNQPSIPVSSISVGQSCGCRPSLSIGQPISVNQPCGNQVINQCNQPSLQLSNLPISLGNQLNQASFSVPTPTINLSNLQISNQQCGCNQQCSCNQASIPQRVQSISVNKQVDCQPSLSIPRNQVAISSNYDSACVVPSAILQAPPYGIMFAGDNLIIDGAVQVCGSMPFNSVMEFGGVLPSSGSGCVQYSCNDLCA